MPRLPNSLAFALIAAAGGTIAMPAFAAQTGAAPETRAEISVKIAAKFKTLDANGDGTIDKTEIETVNTKAAERADATIDKKLHDEFARLDTNKDNQISFAEFKAVAPEVKGVPSDVLIKRMDRDSNGKVSLKEYTDVTLQAFDKVDSNKDGVLSEAERKAASSR